MSLYGSTFHLPPSLPPRILGSPNPVPTKIRSSLSIDGTRFQTWPLKLRLPIFRHVAFYPLLKAVLHSGPTAPVEVNPLYCFRSVYSQYTSVNIVSSTKFQNQSGCEIMPSYKYSIKIFRAEGKTNTVSSDKLRQKREKSKPVLKPKRLKNHA